MVPRRGLEPPRPCERQHLKLVRLPIPPSGHGVGERLYGCTFGLSTAPGANFVHLAIFPVGPGVAFQLREVRNPDARAIWPVNLTSPWRYVPRAGARPARWPTGTSRRGHWCSMCSAPRCPPPHRSPAPAPPRRTRHSRSSSLHSARPSSYSRSHSDSRCSPTRSAPPAHSRCRHRPNNSWWCWW